MTSPGAILEQGQALLRNDLETGGAVPGGKVLLTDKFLKIYLVLRSGPKHPRDEPYKCDHHPILKALDEFPKSINWRGTRAARFGILITYLVIWTLCVTPFLKKTLYGVPDVKKNTKIIHLPCRESYEIWHGKNSKCGLNAKLCLLEFKEPGISFNVSDQEVLIKCPAFCDSESKIYSSITTGSTAYKYRSYIVGGGLLDLEDHLSIDGQISLPYRADSFPCAAALHAGLISPKYGGCARLSFASSNDKSILDYRSKKGKNLGTSIDFDGIFPYSFVFKKEPLQKESSNCFDYRLIVTGLNILFGLPIIFYCTSVKGYVVLTFVGFWTVVLSLDPPVAIDSLSPETTAFLISVGFRRFLPLGFVLYVIWHFTSSKTVGNGASPIGKAFIWYPLYWVGIMNNITFDKYLAIDRLLVKDLKENLHAGLTISIILSIALVAIVLQTIAIWKAGKFAKYISFYALLAFVLVLLSLIPGLSLRLHHYIIGLILIPGTSNKGAPAIFFQGLLLGLIVNGVARWDFASIVETNGSLRRDDPFDSIDSRPPIFNLFEPATRNISWTTIESASKIMDDIVPEIIIPEKLNGFSLLVNDIERYRGSNSSVIFDELLKSNRQFGWEVSESLKYVPSREDLKFYLRVAKASTHDMSVGDYTNAAILQWPSGKWMAAEPGVT